MSGMPSWAVRGAKCVFVGGNHSGRLGWRELGFKLNWEPTPQAIYTIRSVSPDGTGYIRLSEHTISGFWPDGSPFSDGWASVEAFRPLITQQDDIANHFKALLDVPEQVGA